VISEPISIRIISHCRSSKRAVSAPVVTTRTGGMFPTMAAEFTVMDGSSNLSDPDTISLPPGPPGNRTSGPRLTVETHDIDHQRIALPAAPAFAALSDVR
jgi:hypothetical protein